MRGEIVAQLGHSAILVEIHIVSVVVGTLVVEGNVAEELATAHAVVEVCLHAGEGSSGEVEVCAYALLIGLTGDDIDDTAHSVGTIEEGCGSAHDFYVVGYHGLVGVGDGVSEDTLILGVSVDKYHDLSCSGIDASDADASSRSSADSIAHESALCDEEVGDLLREGGQEADALELVELFAVDGRYGGNDSPFGYGSTCACNYDIAQGGVVGDFIVRRFCGSAQRGDEGQCEEFACSHNE